MSSSFVFPAAGRVALCLALLACACGDDDDVGPGAVDPGTRIVSSRPVDERDAPSSSSSSGRAGSGGSPGGHDAGTTTDAGPVGPVLGELGDACRSDAQCTDGHCAAGHCTVECGDGDRCLPGWFCASSSRLCTCQVDDKELSQHRAGGDFCDGMDSDCNGIVDDQADADADCQQQSSELFCQDGRCICDDADKCNGSCTDLANDAKNCGACGHVCAPGATCSDGECRCGDATAEDCDACVKPTSDECSTCQRLEPRCLIHHVNDPTRTYFGAHRSETTFAIDGDDVFWTSQVAPLGTYRAPLAERTAGDAPPSPPLNGEQVAVGLFAMGDFAVLGGVIGSGAIWGLPKHGCSIPDGQTYSYDCGRILDVTAAHTPGALIQYGSSLYWLDDCAAVHSLDATLQAVADLTPCQVASTSRSLVVDGDGLFVMLLDGNGSRLMHAPLSGGATTMLWSSTELRASLSGSAKDEVYAFANDRQLAIAISKDGGSYREVANAVIDSCNAMGVCTTGKGPLLDGVWSYSGSAFYIRRPRWIIVSAGGESVDELIPYPVMPPPNTPMSSSNGNPPNAAPVFHDGRVYWLQYDGVWSAPQ